MALNSGYFHVALVQKNMYKQVDSMVYVFAPQGPDVQNHLKRIEGYISHRETPTLWVENVYTEPGCLKKMLKGK